MPLPLAGRRILITRAAGQASLLAEALHRLGAETISIPTIELAPPASYDVLDDALRSIGQFDWLLFTSANAVHALCARAAALGLSMETAKRSPWPRVAAIGPATAAAACHASLCERVDLMPAKYVAESFVDGLLPHAEGARMLLVRAAEARDLLPEQLRHEGADVTIAEAYRTVVPTGAVGALRELFARNPPDAISFTSASTARNLAALLESAELALPGGIVLASIGPITSQAMHAAGFEPTLEASESTIPALANSLAKHFSRHRNLV